MKGLAEGFVCAVLYVLIAFGFALKKPTEEEDPNQNGNDFASFLVGLLWPVWLSIAIGWKIHDLAQKCQ